MATSSRYIQLSSSVLMEYVYSDQSQINVPGNEFRISTSTAPIWKIENSHNGQPQILNADNAEVVQDGLPIGTGNVRNRSFAVLEPYKVALLDIDKIVFYNDYDPKLTPSANLPINFTAPQAPVYDTIRLHLVQGFNFEENDSLIFSVKAKKKDGSTFILSNLVYRKEDTWETLNPSPFFFGGRVYNSYLEIRVLSLYNLIYDYWLGSLTGDTVVERITDFNGVLREQPISIFFSFSNVQSVIEDQTYLNLQGVRTIDIPVRDQFETVSGYIAESTDGDYIEFYATQGGSIIGSYINDLNNNGYDFIVLHDLVVSEYVYDSSTDSYSWIKTDDLQLSQISDYDLPNFYRPIIKNSSAISFKIDYTVRLYNREDNTQVWKTSTVISNQAAKYGRITRSINLGSNPVQTKIYNKKVVKDISINRISEPIINNTKYITSLSNNSSISISTSTINPGPTASSPTLVQGPNTLQNTGSSNTQIFTNGLARVLIPDSTVFLKFNIYQMVNGNNSPMNLSGLGDLILTFTSNTDEDVDFVEFPNPYTSKGNGEVVFRLSEQDSKKVLAFTNKTFKIFLKNEANDKTFLYSGKFYNITEYQNLQIDDRVAKLEAQIQSLNTILTSQQATITSLTTGATSTNALTTLISKQNEFIAEFVANFNNPVTSYNSFTQSGSSSTTTTNTGSGNLTLNPSQFLNPNLATINGGTASQFTPD